MKDLMNDLNTHTSAVWTRCFFVWFQIQFYKKLEGPMTIEIDNPQGMSISSKENVFIIFIILFLTKYGKKDLI